MKKKNSISKTIRVLTLLFVSVIAAHGIAFATDSQHARVQLVAEPWDGKSAIRVLVRFTMDKGWNLYWKNPGDSGLPPELDWKLPKGFTVSELSFPVPEKLMHGDGIMYGYTRAFDCMAKVQPPKQAAGGRRGLTLTATADWLVCLDRCIREKADVSCTVPVFDVKKRAAFERLWRKAQATLPLKMNPRTMNIRSATSVREGSALRITFVMNMPITKLLTDFYPEVVKDAVVDLQSVMVKNGTVSFLVTPEQANIGIDTVSGVLIYGTSAYYCVVDLQ